MNLRQQQLSALDDLIKARFVEMFGDPVSNPKGWDRVRFDTICENLDSRRVPITSTDRISGVYPYYGASGIVDYVDDYSNNNGEFNIGEGEYLFTTKWSKASQRAIHALNYAPNIESIARIKAPCELTQELSGEYDFSSNCRTPNIGDVILWKNKNGKYAATKIISILDDTRGADHDELTCEYMIYA